jgi:phosphoribosylformylglycinamidine synthase
MAEACRALDFPVVSGNVSLYNETKNDDGTSLAILPTPAIGGVGLLEDWEKSATIGLKEDGNTVVLLSYDAVVGVYAPGHLGQSLWLSEIASQRGGSAPIVDLRHERRIGEFVRLLIERGLAQSVHDIADGGLLVAAAEMALAGNLGIRIMPDYLDGPDLLFGEDQGRYLVETRDWESVMRLAQEHDLNAEAFGGVGGDALVEDRLCEQPLKLEVKLADLRAAHEGFFPKLMGSALTPEF